ANYTLTVSNAGPATALNIALTDTLPPDAMFVSASAGGSESGGSVTWPAIVSMNAGTASNFTVTIGAPATGILTNFVASTADSFDLNANNNNGSTTNARVISTIVE